MSQLFISYARDDLQWVKGLVEVLTTHRKWHIWWDGDVIAQRPASTIIQKALDNTKCVLVVWSYQSINSPWVLDEAGEGRDRNILATVIKDPVRPPLGFRQTQWTNLINWKGEEDFPEIYDLVMRITNVVSGSGVTHLKAYRAAAARVNEQYMRGDFDNDTRRYALFICRDVISHYTFPEHTSEYSQELADQAIVSAISRLANKDNISAPDKSLELKRKWWHFLRK